MDGMAAMELTHTELENERKSKNGGVAHRAEWDCTVVFAHNKYSVNIKCVQYNDVYSSKDVCVYASARVQRGNAALNENKTNLWPCLRDRKNLQKYKNAQTHNRNAYSYSARPSKRKQSNIKRNE